MGFHAIPPSDHRVTACPACAGSIYYIGGLESEMAALAQHREGDCRARTGPSSSTARPKCIAPGCRSRPTFSTRVSCSSCGGVTCMSHRHVDDHACAAASASAPTAVRAARAGFLARITDNINSEVPSKAVPEPAHGPSATGSAGDSDCRLRLPAGCAAEALPSHGPERCPFCTTCFETVGALIEHVETGHSLPARWRREVSAYE